MEKGVKKPIKFMTGYIIQSNIPTNDIQGTSKNP